MSRSTPTTLGALKASGYRSRPVKDELRENLIARLEAGDKLFPGIRGYEDSVVPQLVNAILARHDFILLGLRGQAKSRILRQLTGLLDARMPVIAGSEVNDDPLAPISKYGRETIAEHGDDTPIDWLAREQRYLEKLATPDVTIADIIGDLDPIKAARGGYILSDELTIHYGMLPRANRGIFAMNELPDLSPRIQVGMFNILEEGDVQIKGYPIRLRLDLLIAFTANPEDYTARGKIITPLKDPHRRGSAHALPEGRRDGDGNHRAGGVARAQRTSPADPDVRARSRRADGLPGAHGIARGPAQRREPANAHRGPRNARLQCRTACDSSG